MRPAIEKKLNQISEIWNNYIWEYRFCNSKIKFTTDVRSNYFGDILGYISDTFPLIYNEKETENFSQTIERTVSFLQAIYVQQDFLEELLYIFRCDIDKGILKDDENYSINREIRNELVGHPIRKKAINGTLQLVSSTIFSNFTNNENISYLRYHINRNYSFEQMSFSKKDIIERHVKFLTHYLDKIIVKLKGILSQFGKEIEAVERTVANAPFSSLIKVLETSFENIFKGDYLYKPEILIEVYTMQDKHARYRNAIRTFMRDLNQAIADRKDDISDLISDANRFSVSDIEIKIPPPKIEIVYADQNSPKLEQPISYTYEIGKLVDRKDISRFMWASLLLKDKCKSNDLVLAELDHMERNLDSDLEYYCSYNLIKTILREQ